MTEEARKLLQEANDGTLSVIARLPVTPPADALDRGPGSDRYLASFDPIIPGTDGDAARRFDNAHFSMGRAFYHLGAMGIAEKAEAACLTAATERDRLNLTGIAKVWRS